MLFTWLSFKRHEFKDFPKPMRIIILRYIGLSEYNKLIKDLCIDDEIMDEVFDDCITKIGFVDVVKRNYVIRGITEYLGVKMYKNVVSIPKSFDKETFQELRSKLMEIIDKDINDLYNFYVSVKTFNDEKSKKNPYEGMVPEYDENTDTFWDVPVWYTPSSRKINVEEWVKSRKSWIITIQ